MNYIILDTDVASLSFKKQLPPALLSVVAHRPACITFVTYGELTQWTTLRKWGQHKRDALAHWLSGIPVLPGSEDVAQVWGNISAYARLRGRPRPHNDSWIAACCLAYGLPLATLNVKDYVDFVEHEGLALVSG